jgi:hypothetical protein
MGATGHSGVGARAIGDGTPAGGRIGLPSTETLQVSGIALVILAMLAAELASLALALSPGSALLWWLNLELFRGMNATYSVLMTRYSLDYSVTVPIMLGLLALSVAAYRRRHRFALGMLSNAAFIWCGFTAYVWYVYKAPLATAGVGELFASNFEGSVLLAYIVLASLIGVLVTHVSYLRAGMGMILTKFDRRAPR